MSRIEWDDDEVSDSRAGCLLWVLVGLVVVAGILVDEWEGIWDWFQGFIGMMGG